MLASMKTAILIHGWPSKEEYFDPIGPSPSNRHWFPWLQHNLIINGILAQTPEMLDAWEPRYEKWKKVFEQFNIDEEAILVGHSCGAGFLVRWLSENKVKVGKVMLVAPWIDADHDEREDVADLFDFDIDPELVSRTNGITIFVSSDDEKPIQRSVEVLEETIKGIVIKRFEDKGHFVIGDMGTEKFPELLEEVLK